MKKSLSNIFFAQFIEKQQIAKDIFDFYFSFPKGFKFLPGQYVQLTISHTEVDDRGSSRFFTIASSPTEEMLMITSRKGKSSFKKALFNLEKEARVQFFGPMGMFVLSED